MSDFLTRAAISPRRDGRWQLDTALAWEIGHKGSGIVWRVPPRFVTDLASIPLPARVLFDRGDARYALPAILHDHLLENGWSRVSAAGEFHEALCAAGVARWRRLIMFLAVALWRYR